MSTSGGVVMKVQHKYQAPLKLRLRGRALTAGLDQDTILPPGLNCALLVTELALGHGQGSKRGVEQDRGVAYRGVGFEEQVRVLGETRVEGVRVEVENWMRAYEGERRGRRRHHRRHRIRRGRVRIRRHPRNRCRSDLQLGLVYGVVVCVESPCFWPLSLIRR